MDRDDVYDGAGLVNLSYVACGVILVAGAAGAMAPGTLGPVTVTAAGICFVAGSVAFLYGYAGGVVRSRVEHVTLGGLFFLSGTAPKLVRRRLRGAFIAQCVIATAAASLRPYTAVAFIVIAPMMGLGLMATWGARHGTFFDKGDPRIDGATADAGDEAAEEHE